MNYLFKYNNKSGIIYELPEKYELKVFKPTIRHPFLSLINKTGKTKNFHSFIVELRWAIASKFRYTIYYVVYNEQIIHTSYCENKCFKFPFMKKNDIHIGPCHTNSEHRGKNIYPAVLSYICTSIKNQSIEKYMIIEESNVASINGVQKVGFKKEAKLLRTKRLHVYKIQGEN